MKTVDRTSREKAVVSVGLSAEAHKLLSDMADSRGMKDREFLSRVVRWIASLDHTERAIVLDQISRGDVPAIAAMVVLRTPAQQPEAVERAAQIVEDAVRQVQRRESRKGKAG